MKKVWILALAIITALNCVAQDTGVETQNIGVVIDAHALVDVINDEIVFDFSSDDPSEAGSGFVLGPNKEQSAFLNYSLMRSNGGADDGTISVKINNLKEGMYITLLADATPSNGLDPNKHGTLGTVSPHFDATQGVQPVKLSSLDQVMIENIGSSYTGDGAGYGYQLFYTMNIADYSKLDADNGNQDVGTITYTIAE